LPVESHDRETHRGSSKQPHSDRRDEKDRYPVNDQGIVVSPDNIKRAREHREVKNVDGKWVKPEDTGETLSIAFLDEVQSSDTSHKVLSALCSFSLNCIQAHAFMHFRSAHLRSFCMHGPDQAVCDCITVGHRA